MIKHQLSALQKRLNYRLRIAAQNIFYVVRNGGNGS